MDTTINATDNTATIPARRRGRPAGVKNSGNTSTPSAPKATNFAKILAQKLHAGPDDTVLSEMAWSHAQEFVATLDSPVDGFQVLLTAYKNYNKFHKNTESAESVNTLFDALKTYALENVDEGMIELVELFQTVVNKANRPTEIAAEVND